MTQLLYHRIFNNYTGTTVFDGILLSVTAQLIIKYIIVAH